MTRTAIPPRHLVVGLLCTALGCAPVSAVSGGDDSPDAGADGGSESAALDQFFGLETIHAIDITVSQPGVQSLLAEPRTYVQGAVSIDGTRYQGIGVRLKGQAGSFVPLDGEYPEISGDGNGKPGKSAFILDFNRFASGQAHLGLKKLTVNNMVQDPSGIHEFLGYALFRDGGVPAPRTGWAKLAFNGQDKGLYALIETPDNSEFLERWYGTSEGNLYEGAYGVDLVEGRWQEYDQDAGDDRSKEDLAALVSALGAVGETGDPMSVLQQHFDLEEYATFAATELYLGHWDGYAWSANNYMIHHDPEDGLWTFLPWGIDQIFEDATGEFGGVMRSPGPSWGEGGGRVHSLCFASSACRALLASAYDDLLDRIAALGLADLADDARAAIEPLVLAESTAYGDPELTVEALDQVASFINTRRDDILRWLPCLEGARVDGDNDSYDDCTLDCDPRSAEIHPGAVEQCNFTDDDCNGVLDDPGHCPRCLDTAAPDGREYSLCVEPKTWSQAREHCLSRGQDLASIHDGETSAHLAFTLIEELGIDSGWIGLNDRQSEGTFTWADGSPVDFQRWAAEAPSPEEELDCVASYPFGWIDSQCEHERPFICR